jgi:hypothetical protein
MPYLGTTHISVSDDERSKDGQETEIDFSEYLERINVRAIESRKNRKEKQKQKYSYQKPKADQSY